jgi:hypothetical protein
MAEGLEGLFNSETQFLCADALLKSGELLFRFWCPSDKGITLYMYM